MSSRYGPIRYAAHQGVLYIYALSVYTYRANPSHHWALCAALAANSRWPALPRAARSAREGVGNSLNRIFSYTYELLGALCAGERIADVKTECGELAAELRRMPAFTWNRTDWRTVQNAVCERVKSLQDADRNVADALTEFMDGKRQLGNLITVLEAV